jgi:hypothetical protein
MAKERARCLEAFSCEGLRFAEGDTFDPEIYSRGIRDILILEGKIEIEDVAYVPKEGESFDVGMAVAGGKAKKGKR